MNEPTTELANVLMRKLNHADSSDSGIWHVVVTAKNNVGTLMATLAFFPINLRKWSRLSNINLKEELGTCLIVPLKSMAEVDSSGLSAVTLSIDLISHPYRE